jgi:hypothetical protein
MGELINPLPPRRGDRLVPAAWEAVASQASSSKRWCDCSLSDALLSPPRCAKYAVYSECPVTRECAINMYNRRDNRLNNL